jgi:hypothetical protein
MKYKEIKDDLDKQNEELYDLEAKLDSINKKMGNAEELCREKEGFVQIVWNLPYFYPICMQHRFLPLLGSVYRMFYMILHFLPFHLEVTRQAKQNPASRCNFERKDINPQPNPTDEPAC